LPTQHFKGKGKHAMIRHKLSPKEEVLAQHRVLKTNEATFAYELVLARVISSIEALQRIYDDLVKSGEMEATSRHHVVVDRTRKEFHVCLYRLIER
jgi:hypothetical protein